MVLFVHVMSVHLNLTSATQRQICVPSGLASTVVVVFKLRKKGSISFEVGSKRNLSFTGTVPMSKEFA